MFIYDPYNIRTFYIQSFPNVLLQDSDSIYLLLQRKYTPKLRKTKIDITYSWFTKIPSYFIIHVNLILTAVSHYTPINSTVIYTRAQALFAARRTHHATSLDVPTQTRTHNFPKQLLFYLFQTINDFLYQEHSCYKSVITVLRLITHLNLK